MDEGSCADAVDLYEAQTLTWISSILAKS